MAKRFGLGGIIFNLLSLASAWAVFMLLLWLVNRILDYFGITQEPWNYIIVIVAFFVTLVLFYRYRPKGALARVLQR